MAQRELIFKIKVEGAERSAQTAAEVGKEIDRLEKELNEATAGTERFIKAQKELRTLQSSLKTNSVAYRSELNRANRLQEQAAKRMQDFGGAINLVKGAAKAFIALDLAGRIKELASQGVSLAGEYENTAIAFEAFLGSAERGKTLLAELNKFSVETPFTPEQVIQAGKALVAVGVTAGETGKLLRDLGNVASGTGTNFNELVSIFAKFKTQGRLFQEDVNQLTGRGIPIVAELAKVLGTTEANVRKLTEAGKVGFPEVQKALEGLVSEGGKFGGLIEKQSKTLPGLLSTLEGSWNDFLRVLAQSSLLQPAKTAIAGITDVVNELRDAVNPQEKINAEAITEVKKALALEGLSKLTKAELDQRQEQLNQAILDEKQSLKSLEDNLRTFDERNKARIEEQKKRAEEIARTGAIGAGGADFLGIGTGTPEDKKSKLKSDLEAQRVRVAAIEQAQIDIIQLQDNAAKIEEARKESERADYLKLQIFRRSVELESLQATLATETQFGELREESIEKVIQKEKQLSELRVQLANLSAKNGLAKELNAAQETEKVKEATFQAEKNRLTNLDFISEQLRKNLLKNLKEIPNATDAASRGIDDTAKSVDGVSRAAERMTNQMELVFGENGIVANFEKFAPLAFDILGDVFDEQASKLDKLVELQERRVQDALSIAEQGNAAQLAEERKRLAALQDEREKAARRSEALARAETRVQIGLAVAKAAASSLGIGGIGALVAGGIVAVGLPALINNLPLFEDGGVVGGNPHSLGGTPLIAERGEFITNKQSSAAFMPALQNINLGKADPALVNAAATGNISNYFNLQLQPIAARLESVETAIREQPTASFLIDESGWAKRNAAISAKIGRVSKVVG